MLGGLGDYVVLGCVDVTIGGKLEMLAKAEFVVGVEEFYCAGLAVADYVVQVQFVVEGECLGFVLVVMLLLHYNIYMQYKYICNTNIHIHVKYIHIFTYIII